MCQHFILVPFHNVDIQHDSILVPVVKFQNLFADFSSKTEFNVFRITFRALCLCDSVVCFVYIYLKSDKKFKQFFFHFLPIFSTRLWVNKFSYNRHALPYLSYYTMHVVTTQQRCQYYSSINEVYAQILY